jgi:multiple sugar transport system substrate-binding protein
MSRKRKFLFLPVLLIIAFVVAACGESAGSGGGSGAAASGPINLTYWVINSDPIRLPVLEAHVAAFNASQDRIIVEAVPIPQDDALNRLNVALSANEGPDVSDLLHGWVAGFALRGVLYDLSPRFNAWENSGDMVPALVQEVRNLDPQQRLFMMPATSNTHTMWVRTDWLTDLGITNWNDWNWNDFFNAVEAMTDPSIPRFGHTIRGGAGSAATLFESIFSNSGEQVFVNGVSTINSPTNVAFVERYFALYHDGHAPEASLTHGHQEITSDFGVGIAGTFLHNLGSFANQVQAFENNPDAFAAAPMPRSVLGTRSVSTSVHGYAIFEHTEHPEAAFEFLTWMVNADNNSEWNQTIGQLPSNSRVSEHAWFNEATHIATMTAAVSEASSFGHPQFLPDFAHINNSIVGPAIQEALQGQITVQELLDLWAAELNRSYAEYQEHVANQ